MIMEGNLEIQVPHQEKDESSESHDGVQEPCSQGLPDPPQINGQMPHQGSPTKESRSLQRTSTARTRELYQDAHLRAMKLEERRRQEEPTRDSFKPNLSTEASIDVASTFDERQLRRTSTARTHDLHRDAHLRAVKLEERRRQEEPTRDSFKPNLSTVASIDVASTFDERQRQQRKLPDSPPLDPECRFSPILYTKNSRVTRSIQDKLQTPVVDRLHDKEGQRLKKEQSKIKKEAFDTEGCTFSPVIVSKTYSMRTVGQGAEDELQNEAGPVHERLYNTAAKHKQKLFALQQSHEQQMSEVHTFTPKTNPSKTLNGEGDNLPAHDRLYQQAEGKRKSKVPGPPHDPECTFKPQLVTLPREDGNNEAEEKRVERLYKIGVAKQKDRSLKTPRKGKGSVLLKNDSTIFGEAEDVNAHIRNRKEEEELQKYPFKPVLVTKNQKKLKELESLQQQGAREETVAPVKELGSLQEQGAREETVAPES